MKGIHTQLSAPGLLFCVLGLCALMMPFMTLAANRIVAGEGRMVWAIAGPQVVVPGLGAVIIGLAMGLLAGWTRLRLAGAILGLGGLLWLLTQGAPLLLSQAGEYARVSPAAGFWCLLVVLTLLMADALATMKPGPMVRGLLLAAVLGVLALILWSGVLSDLSVLQEFAGRRTVFFREALRHLSLAFGSLAAATVIGFPLGILCLGHI